MEVGLENFQYGGIWMKTQDEIYISATSFKEWQEIEFLKVADFWPIFKRGLLGF